MSIVFAEKTRGIGRIRKSRLPHQAQHCMELTLNWAPGDTDTERWKMSSGSGRKASCPPWALGVWDGLTTECNGKDSLMKKKHVLCSLCLLIPWFSPSLNFSAPMPKMDRIGIVDLKNHFLVWCEKLGVICCCCCLLPNIYAWQSNIKFHVLPWLQPCKEVGVFSRASICHPENKGLKDYGLISHFPWHSITGAENDGE